MIVIGADTHKSTHTLAAVDAATGRVVATRTVGADRDGMLAAWRWAHRLDGERVWALEDCRHVSGRLERCLIGQGERVVRVAPKLMGQARRGARRPGKSDEIDAIAVARAALQEGVETLPVAFLDEPAFEIRLLCDHRADLVAERTRHQNRLRWHLVELDAELEAGLPTRALDRDCWLDRIARRLAAMAQTARVRVARDALRRIRELTRAERALERELTAAIEALRPALLAEDGIGPITAATLIGRTAGAERFPTDGHFARQAGAAPIPVASGRRDRVRLNPGGDRQLNCALHRIAVTRARTDPRTRAYLDRKLAEGKTRPEAYRCLKRHLARHVFKLLRPAPPTTRASLGDRPPASNKRGVMIHCNTPLGTPALT
jgi:transposase